MAKIYRSIEGAPDYYHSEPDFPTNLDSLGDLESNKRFIESWNSDVNWCDIKGDTEGYITNQEPFIAIHLKICTFETGVENHPEVYGFNIIVRCHEFQLHVDESIRKLAKLRDLSIHKMEWKRIV